MSAAIMVACAYCADAATVECTDCGRPFCDECVYHTATDRRGKQWHECESCYRRRTYCCSDCNGY